MSVIADDLAAGSGGHRAPGVDVDRVADEADAAVAEAHADAAAEVAAGGKEAHAVGGRVRHRRVGRQRGGEAVDAGVAPDPRPAPVAAPRRGRLVLGRADGRVGPVAGAGPARPAEQPLAGQAPRLSAALVLGQVGERLGQVRVHPEQALGHEHRVRRAVRDVAETQAGAVVEHAVGGEPRVVAVGRRRARPGQPRAEVDDVAGAGVGAAAAVDREQRLLAVAGAEERLDHRPGSRCRRRVEGEARRRERADEQRLVRVELPAEVLLLDVRQELSVDGVAERGGVARPGGEHARQLAVGALVAVQREAQLLQVVLAGHPGGSLPHLLDCGQQEADEDGDDGDHD